jgi:GNAT superfamily N-acetyltransferase
MLLTEMFGDPNTPTNQARSEIKAIALSIAPNIDFSVDVKEADGDIYMAVSMLRVPKTDRKKGIGSAIMRAVCDYADEKGIIVVLSPTSEFGTGKATLMRFYKSFGFVPNSGRSRNFLVTETMIRYPVVK